MAGVLSRSWCLVPRVRAHVSGARCVQLSCPEEGREKNATLLNLWSSPKPQTWRKCPWCPFRHLCTIFIEPAPCINEFLNEAPHFRRERGLRIHLQPNILRLREWRAHEGLEATPSPRLGCLVPSAGHRGSCHTVRELLSQLPKVSLDCRGVNRAP